jgi:rRNA-processing protein FCF1
MEKSNKIMIDTNFFLTIIRYKIHGIEEIKKNIKSKFYTLSGVIEELDYLSKDKKIKKEFGIIKQIIKNEKIIVLKSQNNNVDEELIEKSNEYIIATNDKELRKKIREKKGKSIFIRKLTLVDMNEITH